MMEDRLALMLRMQYQLQFKMPPVGTDIMQKVGNERAELVRNMILACEDELHEAMNETGWKPWATSRHFNAKAFTKEMIDAWHFFMNLMLVGAAASGMGVDEYADYFTRKYIEKNAVNAERQVEGYDGVTGKCPHCKRDLAETDPHDHFWAEVSGTPVKFCSQVCAVEFGPTTRGVSNGNRIS